MEKPAPELNPTCNSRVGPADRRKEGTLNKRRGAELVPKGRGQTDDVVAARAVNADPWGPLHGWVKKRCSQCRYFFAMLVAEATSRVSGLCRLVAARPTRPVTPL